MPQSAQTSPQACSWTGTLHYMTEVTTMTKTEKEMWRINIENDVDEACTIYGAETVSGVFRRYDATCFDDLCPSYYEEVFGDLELMINDN